MLAPTAVNVAVDIPEHRVVTVAVTVVEGNGFTVVVTLLVVEQPVIGSTPLTVYNVVDVGDATTVDAVGLSSVVDGDQA